MLSFAFLAAVRYDGSQFRPAGGHRRGNHGTPGLIRHEGECFLGAGPLHLSRDTKGAGEVCHHACRVHQKPGGAAGGHAEPQT